MPVKNQREGAGVGSLRHRPGTWERRPRKGAEEEFHQGTVPGVSSQAEGTLK